MAISRKARRDIGDTIVLHALPWSGALDEVAFLGRLYDLDELPSYDNRFSTAGRDIWQHRVNNSDWEDRWVFEDSRFNLLNGDDEIPLRFLSEMLRPVVLSDTTRLSDWPSR